MASLLPLDVEMAGRVSGEKKKKKKKRARRDLGDGVMRRGVIYVGRLPHGFYETQLKGYFSQFGTVTKVHVSRNKKVCVYTIFASLSGEPGGGRGSMCKLYVLIEPYT